MQHFNEDYVSIISTLHVSALIGHLQVLTVGYVGAISVSFDIRRN
jgi:hypothetical protein